MEGGEKRRGEENDMKMEREGSAGGSSRGMGGG